MQRAHSLGFIQLALIAGLAGAAGGAAVAWKVTSWYHKAAAADAAQDARELVNAANQKANNASAELEAVRARLAAAQATVNRRIERAIEANRDWASQPLPDGVRDAARAARQAAGASEPDDAVPTIPVERDTDDR
jgi:hypothetical protein